MSDSDREYIKDRLERNYIAQMKYIGELSGERFEDVHNRIVYDGLLLNQIDPTVKKELLKRQKLHKILIDFYEILRKPCQFDPQTCIVSTATQHFYADLSPFLLKKNLTEFDKIVVSKGNEYFKCLFEEFPDDFAEFKKSIMIQQRTKPYKLLFSSMMMENLTPYTNCTIEDLNTVTDSDGSMSSDHWTNDIGEMANNILTVPQNHREEKFQKTLEIIHKKYGYEIKFEDHLRRTLNYGLEKKQMNIKERVKL